MILIALGMSFHQLSISGGFYFSHAEVAGPYSGVLFGITNTMAQVSNPRSLFLSIVTLIPDPRVRHACPGLLDDSGREPG